VEKVYLAQDFARAEKPIDVPVPWDTDGLIVEGDFICVVSGDFEGKEGYVKAIGRDSDIIIAKTSREAGQLPIIFNHQSDSYQQWVSISFIFFIFHLLITK